MRPPRPGHPAAALRWSPLFSAPRAHAQRAAVSLPSPTRKGAQRTCEPSSRIRRPRARVSPCGGSHLKTASIDHNLERLVGLR
eukprot:6191471-Pleurochrysis_carterae.AAC.3